MKTFSIGRLGAWRACALLAAVTPAIVFGGDGTAPASRKIAYVSTDLHWSVYQTPDAKAECPNGFNEYGPREAFAKLYPRGGTEADTHLVRESLKFFPADTKDKFPYVEAQGPIAIGLNLDGKVGPRDFTSPSGEKGIDNELYRVIGCSRQYRGPEGQLQLFGNRMLRQMPYNRSIIEITELDSLKNDEHVVVTTYRGLDPLMTDATGENIMPGGTQRLDTRFGKRFVQQLEGKIVDGVLITEPKDIVWPWAIFPGTFSEYKMLGARLRLNLTDKKADGLMGGYADVERFYKTVINWSTHHLAYGQLDPSGFHRKLLERADGYPGESGKNTAISSSIRLQMVQVFVEPGEQAVAQNNKQDAT